MKSKRRDIGDEFEAQLTAVSGIPGWHPMHSAVFPPGVRKNRNLVSGVFARYDEPRVLDDEHFVLGELIVDCDRGSHVSRYHYLIAHCSTTGWYFSPPTANYRQDHHFQWGNRPPIRPIFGTVTPTTF